jgi:murein DD-endopeptidase MepM/ murein hydrolase activator NlpD
LRRLAEHINTALERHFPDRRLFIRSENETRFLRLTPLTQVVALGGSALVLGWTIIVTAIMLMDSIGAGTLREQAMRDQFLYEARLGSMAAQRDQSAEEARSAHERFNIAMERISEMQSALLASEERRKEMETGIEVIQATLRRTMRERDAARAEAARYAMVEAEAGAGNSRDADDTLDFLVTALERTAQERDGIAAIAAQARNEAEHIALEKRLLQDRNNLIFTRLEEAVSVSMEPLERMFTEAGLPPQQVLEQVRRGYAAPEERLSAISISTKGSLVEDADEARVNDILAGLDRVNLYRIAAEKAPFAQPVNARVRFTSGFGSRRDPKTGASRMHSGVDFAGPSGTPIQATSDGVVKKAGWQGGYGNAVIIEHAFGIETLYAHLSRIDVREGQRVSRGDRIGGMGTTGRSTGVHLHYEVRIGGSAVNPMTYIRAARNVF